MDGRTDGRMDGWMDGWMDRWKDLDKLEILHFIQQLVFNMHAHAATWWLRLLGSRWQFAVETGPSSGTLNPTSLP